MSTQNNKAFYVYTLAHPDGRVFYVGKGTGLRIEHHEAKARLGKAGKTHDAIRQIWASGGKVVKAQVYHTDDEQDAFAEERRLIALHGRESLTNIQPGVRSAAEIGTRKKYPRIPGQPIRPHSGRPTINERAMVTVAFRVHPDTLAQVERRAKKRGISVAQYVRETITGRKDGEPREEK